MKSRTGPRMLTAVAVVTMVLAGVGFIAVMILNAFVLDEYDAYGEVPIPGSNSVHLPAGQVTVTFHTTLIGGGGGSGLPVPPLKYAITGPGGVDLQLTEDYGSTTIVNNDARVRIGYLHVPADGTYDVRLDGNVSAYLSPSVAFGHGSSYGWVPWVLGAVFGFGVVDLTIARIWAARTRGRDPLPDAGTLAAVAPTDVFTPTDSGIRIEELKTIARLHDSGALTDEEYESEKKRVLDGR